MGQENGPQKPEQVNGFDYRLFDGYDGASREPSDDDIAKLLASAPEAVRARVAEFAKEKAANQQK